jgi:broad specificity phosphatase PhoE
VVVWIFVLKTIYLMRHFRVNDQQTNWLNSHAFDQWVDAYDRFPLVYKQIDLPKVDAVYVSTQKRAIKTAEFLELEAIPSEDLIEVEAKAFFKTNLKLPKSFWLMIGRLLWYGNVTKHESRNQTIERARRMIQQLQDADSQSTLLISHGLFLKVLIGEFKKQGYSGHMDKVPKNGKVYALGK